jgi:hypothetical protein
MKTIKTATAHPDKQYNPIILFIALVLALGALPQAFAADSLAARHAAWAGGQANADALVMGLRTGTSITLSTIRADGTTSLAGFTPRGRMSEAEAAAALQRARASLERLGIRRPSAEQIQAALIGGEVQLRDGASTVMDGAVPVAAPASRIAAGR